MTLLVAEQLSKSFVVKRSVLGAPLASLKAVDGVDFSLAQGETLAIVGESGCGKSTVGRLLLRLIEPTDGRVLFDGSDISRFSAVELRRARRQFQLVFQDPFAALNPRMTVGDIIAEPLLLHDIVPQAQRRARTEALLARVGLDPSQARRYPHEFSGGQRQRIVIARALASEPRLIVCDEPVSALDVSIRAQILNLLRDLQRDLGLAMIFISHDLAVVKHIADRVAVMYLGRIVESGPADAVFAQPQHPYTRALLSAIPIASPNARGRRALLEGDVPSPIDPPTGCHLHTRCPHAVDICKSTRPQLSGGSHAVACHCTSTLPSALNFLPNEGTIDPRLAKLMTRLSETRPASISTTNP